MIMSFQIRPATRKELDIMIEWAAKESWNPGLHDANAFYATDPKGFLLGFLDDEPIASISSVAYDDNFGFLGFYIVKPEYRGKGYGIKIWNEAIKHLPTQNIGLDGVVEQQENYKKSGFKLAYNNARYKFISHKFAQTDPRVKSADSVSFDDLNEYDSKFFPIDRKTFLKKWIEQPASTTLVYLVENQIQGYGMIRKCREGYKIGPLFADNFEIADKLFQALVNGVEEDKAVFLDIPEINQDAVSLAGLHKMEKVFATARMYTKKFPDLPIEKIFGVTTFELG